MNTEQNGFANVVITIVVLALAAGGIYFWQQNKSPAPEEPLVENQPPQPTPPPIGSTPNEVPCETTTNSIDCTELALKNKDASYCQFAKDIYYGDDVQPGDGKVACIFELVRATRDKSICENYLQDRLEGCYVVADPRNDFYLEYVIIGDLDIQTKLTIENRTKGYGTGRIPISLREQKNPEDPLQIIWLSQDEWNELVDFFITAGIFQLKQADLGAMEGYCSPTNEGYPEGLKQSIIARYQENETNLSWDCLKSKPNVLVAVQSKLMELYRKILDF